MAFATAKRLYDFYNETKQTERAMELLAKYPQLSNEESIETVPEASQEEKKEKTKKSK